MTNKINKLCKNCTKFMTSCVGMFEGVSETCDEQIKMTDSEKAEESFNKHITEDTCYFSKAEIDIYNDGYLDGLAEGRKEKWHDLRKNPDDLPEEGEEVLVLYSNTYGDGRCIVNKHTLNYELAQYINDEEDTSEWYWVETGTDFDIGKVIAWCELPKFEE